MAYVGFVGRTVVAGAFEWDSEKAESNVAKHGVSFEEAVTVFEDPHLLELEDVGAVGGRLNAIGFSRRGRILFVVTFEIGERTRIISARGATGGERRHYQAG